MDTERPSPPMAISWSGSSSVSSSLLKLKVKPCCDMFCVVDVNQRELSQNISVHSLSAEVLFLPEKQPTSLTRLSLWPSRSNSNVPSDFLLYLLASKVTIDRILNAILMAVFYQRLYTLLMPLK